MKVLLATTAALVATAIAAPHSQKRRAAFERRRAARLAKTLSGDAKIPGPLAVNFTSLDDKIQIGPSEHPEYSSNWAGAVQITTDITEVSATANFPTVSIPSGGSSSEEYGGSAWVGIDGDTCATSILQTGVDWYIEGTQTEYEAWYEWLPEYSYSFDMTVSPGDSITMRVVAETASSGTAYITNESTGEAVSHTFSGETALCQENAEWIVEDFEVEYSNGDAELVPFAEFSTVTFTDAVYTAGGTEYTADGATIIDIEQSGEVLTDCSASGSTVTCSYTG